MLSLRGFVFGVSFALLSFLGSHCHAALIGSVGFNVTGVLSPATGSLSQAFSVTNVVTNNTLSGGWSTVTAGTSVASFIGFPAFSGVGAPITFTGDVNFGTFAGMVGSDSGEILVPGFGNVRILGIGGIFTPGPGLPFSGIPVSGTMLVTLQDTLSTGGRSASITFSTRELNRPVPEPATAAIAGAGLLGLMIAGRGRRKK